MSVNEEIPNQEGDKSNGLLPRPEDSNEEPALEQNDECNGDTIPLHLEQAPAPPSPFGGKSTTTNKDSSDSVSEDTTKPRKRISASADTQTHTFGEAQSKDETKNLSTLEIEIEEISSSDQNVDGRPNEGLPRRVSQIDTGATRVSPSAYVQSQAQETSKATSIPPKRTKVPASNHKADPSSRDYPPGPYLGKSDLKKNASRSGSGRISAASYNSTPRVVRPNRSLFEWNNFVGCSLRVLFGLFFISLILILCVFSILFYQYYRVATTLPDINDLRQRTSQFETTRIFDREGNLLYEILDPNAGRRTYISLAKISPYLVAATIATEDKGFYSHPGFDPFAITRAFVQNYQGGETVSGASTITQQLARTLLFTPEERFEISYDRKIREAILAAEITRRYSKDEILELYLNEIYYGNLAYGVEAAAETYFSTSAEKLSLGQASFLAGLPQAPAVYDVYTNPEATFGRHRDVLVLMYELSKEKGCIEVSNSPQAICMDPVSITTASEEIKNYQFNSPDIKMRFPHWVTYIRSLLEAQYDPQTIYRSGFSVYTTLDPTLQEQAQAAVSEQVAILGGHNTKGGALIAIKPASGEILAMVGSPDFYNESIDGQVNMAINPRQPGSAIKPLTYIASFEKGWTPATLIWDVPSEFTASGKEDDFGPAYKPVNYDGFFHGPVLVRDALANSYNIPAVKALQFVGIYDDPTTPYEEGLIALARRMGIASLNKPDYGLSLTLGGGEISLLELTSAFSTIANMGWRLPPFAITRILDFEGNLVYEYQQPVGEQVIRTEHAYMISSILSDNQARTPAFGANSVLHLPFPAAVKTGTTNDFRDNWTLGYTPDIAIGVWVGNPDYTPMQDTSGVTGAAPIWARVMQTAEGQLTGGNPSPFLRPPGVMDQVVCELSGTFPSQWCPRQRAELFAIDQPPLPKEQDLWQKIAIDTWTGLRASSACAEYTDDRFVLNVTDPWARKWIKKDPQGQAWAESIGFPKPVVFTPSRECTSEDPRPNLQFAFPRDGETLRDSPLGIYAIIDSMPYFEFWQLDYGLGDNPVDWQVLQQGHNSIHQPDLIYNWDLIGFPPGLIELRLQIKGPEDAYAKKIINLNMQVPTPTSTPTPTWTPTPTPTFTPTPTITPTQTPSPSITPSNTQS